MIGDGRQILEHSRIAAVIASVEKGEHVDTERVLALQALDVARSGELFAVEFMDSERLADDEFARAIGQVA